MHIRGKGAEKVTLIVTLREVDVYRWPPSMSRKPLQSPSHLCESLLSHFHASDPIRKAQFLRYIPVIILPDQPV